LLRLEIDSQEEGLLQTPVPDEMIEEPLGQTVHALLVLPLDGQADGVGGAEEVPESRLDLLLPHWVQRGLEEEVHDNIEAVVGQEGVEVPVEDAEVGHGLVDIVVSQVFSDEGEDIQTCR